MRIQGDQITSFCLPVLHEAVSTGDPEMVYTVLQHRDFHNTSMALEGVPELLQKILEVAIKTASASVELNADTAAAEFDILVRPPKQFEGL